MARRSWFCECIEFSQSPNGANPGGFGRDGKVGPARCRWLASRHKSTNLSKSQAFLDRTHGHSLVRSQRRSILKETPYAWLLIGTIEMLSKTPLVHAQPPSSHNNANKQARRPANKT